MLGCSRRTEEVPAAGAEPAASPEPVAAPKVAKPTHDSKLTGVYKIDGYQSSETTCDQLTDVEPQPLYLVLYPFRPSSNPQEVRLGGTFCSEVSLCRALAGQAPEPRMGYSFISGDDASGWQGWAVAGGPGEGDLCAADVQSHRLTQKNPKSIHVETKTVHTVFEPVFEGGTATCHNRAAIDSVTDDSECKGLLVLNATFAGAL